MRRLLHHFCIIALAGMWFEHAQAEVVAPAEILRNDGLLIKTVEWEDVS